MATYSEKFELVRNALIPDFKKRIVDNWEQMFDMWLSCEADMEFGHGYRDHFKAQFEKYITEEVNTLLWFAGKNLVFSIGAFMSFKKNATLKDVLKFTEDFLEEQLDDFDNWCDDIGQAMYKESPEYKKENTIE
jgi:hypothetical protein